MAVCCQNLPLGALSSRSALSVLVGELFKKFGLFLNTGVCWCDVCILYVHLVGLVQEIMLIKKARSKQFEYFTFNFQ